MNQNGEQSLPSSFSGTSLNIATIIRRYVPLERLGPGYASACPFCDATQKGRLLVQSRFGTFTCNSCGANGGIFQFLLRVNKCSLQEALEEVRHVFHLDFNGSWMDTHWKEILEGTDFEITCRKHLEGTKIDFTGTSEQPTIEVSYSMLFTYQQCPYRYKKRYIDHQQDEKTTFFLSLGRTLHTALSEFLRDVLADKTDPADADSLLKILHRKWIPYGYADEEEAQEWFSRAKEMLVNYANSGEAQRRPFAVERTFRARLGHIIVVGQIDRIDQLSDGTYEIIDYKVGGFDSLEESQAQELQTAFYFLGATRGLGIEVSLFSYYYMASGTKLSFDHLPEDVFHQHIEVVVDSINKDREFPARKNLFCQTCRFIPECPLRSR